MLVNPDVTVLDEEMIEDWEGCLSIPDFRGRVPRWRKLRVDGLDRNGNKIHLTADGFFARVIQHEFDHLMGRVYLDRMRDLKTLSHFAEFQRYWMPQEKENACRFIRKQATAATPGCLTARKSESTTTGWKRMAMSTN